MKENKMTSQQTENAQNAILALVAFAKSVGQDYPDLANHAMLETLEIGSWLMNPLDPPVSLTVDFRGKK